MFANWKPKVVTIGSFVAFVVSLLGFWGVTANEVGEFMTANYLWLFGALACLGIFFWGIHQWWKSSRVRPDNVQARLRQWLDYYGLTHRVVQWEPWHFGFEVTHPRQPIMFVYRQKGFGDYLTFQANITGITAEQRVAYDKLTADERTRFYAELSLEVARAEITFTSEQELATVRIEKWIPITPRLSASDVLEALNEIHFSTMIIWAYVALRLGSKPLELTVRPPSSTPDTAASPPSPTP